MSHNQLLQIREFHVHVTLASTRIYPIEQINELDEMIRVYGRGIISCITFFFHDTNLRFHTITLRNSEQNDRFVVEFHHYYNQQLERVELTLDEKVVDFESLLRYLNSRQNLNDRFTRYIVNPFTSSQYMT